MPNTITKQTLQNGPRNVVVKATISGDGSGEESATKLIDMSDYTSTATYLKIKKVDANLRGFDMTLAWDASTDVDIMSLDDGDSVHDFTEIGGLPNTEASGFTGDIMFTTVGLGSGDTGSIVFWLQKHG